jgi:hypothetical protein
LKGHLRGQRPLQQGGWRQGTDGSVWRGTYNGVAADFIIKSNAPASLVFTVSSASSYTATLQSKCTCSIVSALNGIQLYGERKDTCTATVTDGHNGAGQQNSSSDSFVLLAFQRGSVKLHPISTPPLRGGNDVVHD